MRLIDADALINRIVFHTDWPVDEKEAFEDEINAEPTIEPERKEGKWLHGDEMPDYPRISYKPWMLYCSECKSVTTQDDSCLYDFCPDCGADMRESEA